MDLYLRYLVSSNVTHHLRLDFSSRILLVLPHDLTRLRVLFYGWTYHNKQNKSNKHLPTDRVVTLKEDMQRVQNLHPEVLFA